MVTYKSDELGEITADDDKALAKAIRAAKKQAEKDNAERQRKAAIATLHAKATGFHILSRKAAGEEMPTAWRLKTLEDRYNCSGFKRLADNDSMDTIVQVESENGYGTFSIWKRYPIVGVVGNACGGLCVFINDRVDDANVNGITCYAVGVFEGVVSLERIPNINLDEFRTFERRDAELKAQAAASNDPLWQLVAAE